MGVESCSHCQDVEEGFWGRGGGVKGGWIVGWRRKRENRSLEIIVKRGFGRGW